MKTHLIRRCLPLILLTLACGESYDLSDGGADSSAPTAADCVVRDTTGWELRVRPGERECRVLSEPSFALSHPITCFGDTVPWGAWSVDQRVVSLVATCADESAWFNSPANWRPVVCESDRACALLGQVGDEPAVCQAGLCQSVEKPLQHRDVLALCRAENPRTTSGRGEGSVRASELTNEWCPRDGDRCEVPPECRQLE